MTGKQLAMDSGLTISRDTALSKNQNGDATNAIGAADQAATVNKFCFILK
jgi:hypothetical protein